ncbi:hypothetical protein FSARC_4750 [Fusarium sarcochroum]|uniref:Uncharacterized protein n=1 Tax=Fusarium sarcochroum TaxID=1208366 RepID=A0A8H4U1E6_9HYPO|nr:hypothetical protein FSARC_4750 [Fusarium sarcochroum]
MTPQTSFLSLPTEIRDMIYDYALEDVEFTNALTSKSAYTPESLPLLYVDETISRELQPRLYKNHAMVIPLQEPSRYTIGNWKFTPHVTECSRMMKQRSKTLTIEMCQTTKSLYADSSLDEDGEPKEPYEFWEGDGGDAFAKRLIGELLDLKSELPSIGTIKFVFWDGSWFAYDHHWEEPLKKLQKEWPEIFLDVEYNLFDYSDPDAGDGGSNDIQQWHEWEQRTEHAWFAANNFKEVNHRKGDFKGHQIDIEAWDDEDFIYLNSREREDALRYFDVEVRPMFVKTECLYDCA